MFLGIFRRPNCCVVPEDVLHVVANVPFLRVDFHPMRCLLHKRKKQQQNGPKKCQRFSHSISPFFANFLICFLAKKYTGVKVNQPFETKMGKQQQQPRQKE